MADELENLLAQYRPMEPTLADVLRNALDAYPEAELGSVMGKQPSWRSPLAFLGSAPRQPPSINDQARAERDKRWDASPLALAMGLIGPRARLPVPRHSATVYHGTNADFSGPFDLAKAGTAGQGAYMGKQGVYFTLDPLDAAGYGRYVKQVELGLDNPRIIPTTNHRLQLAEPDVTNIRGRGHDALILRLMDRDTATKNLANSWDHEIVGLNPERMNIVRTFDQANPAHAAELGALRRRTPYAFPFGEFLLPNGGW